ncbi:MAG TPA: enolase C-terminal domain-like protein [Candidatus Acidoferrales bacterium]|nr:enolase C-terminal domain-like protein [Candidatus Acidoferrales bacterium]
MKNSRNKTTVEKVKVSTFTVPTDFPEADGTLDWHKTTLVLVEAAAGGKQGLGYTYADEAAATLIQKLLAEVVTGADAMAPTAAYESMWRQIRNLGRPGICSTAISAVDFALWDLKARLLDLPLVTLLGQLRKGAAIYGSGGFTSYSDRQLADQLSGWVKQGIHSVKMKIGREAKRDIERVRVAREAIGADAELYVDANGAYTRKQALAQAEKFSRCDVRWFEEPVSSDDLDGLRLLRDRAPAGMDIAAGEYGYDIFYFQRMLQAGAVDVQQADITRCGGVTAFLQVAALCQAHNVQLSGHTAPALHTHVACAVPLFKNLEYFHDHVRIERMFFDGLPQLADGELRPDLSQPGTGLELKRVDAEKFAA